MQWRPIDLRPGIFAYARAQQNLARFQMIAERGHMQRRRAQLKSKRLHTVLGSDSLRCHLPSPVWKAPPDSWARALSPCLRRGRTREAFSPNLLPKRSRPWLGPSEIIENEIHQIWVAQKRAFTHRHDGVGTEADIVRPNISGFYPVNYFLHCLKQNSILRSRSSLQWDILPKIRQFFLKITHQLSFRRRFLTFPNSSNIVPTIEFPNIYVWFSFRTWEMLIQLNYWTCESDLISLLCQITNIRKKKSTG